MADEREAELRSPESNPDDSTEPSEPTVSRRRSPRRAHPDDRHGHALDQFSEPARRVLVLAEEEARRLHHADIRPEHLLLGLLAGGRAAGAVTVARMGGLNPDELRQMLERRLGLGDDPVEGALGLSDGCKAVLTLAVADAQRQGHPQVDTGHLLIGLVGEGTALQGDMLTALALRGIRTGVGASRPWSGRRPPPGVPSVVQATPSGGTRDNVVTLRVTDDDLASVDALVEVGVARTRSEGAAWLLQAGIAANRPLFERAQGIVGEIRQLREQARLVARAHVEGATDDDAPPPSATPEPSTS